MYGVVGSWVIDVIIFTGSVSWSIVLSWFILPFIFLFSVLIPGPSFRFLHYIGIGYISQFLGLFYFVVPGSSSLILVPWLFYFFSFFI